MPLTKGQILYDRYRIDALLAQGGMGAVYDAFDTRLNVRCAIKENLLFTEASTRQFEREAKMLAALRHPNLPRVTDHFLVAGQGQYLVMDFIEGEDLNQRLKRRGPQAEADVLRWADDVLGALAYLHKRNIIHRDIKPNNVKIAPDGEAVLVDFGIAKELVDEAGMTTTTGARGLTPGFAPPEQYGAWSGRTDARSDIYAFGATLYVLLTNEVPADALSRMTKPEKFVPLARHRVKVSEPLAGAIDRALALEPDERWQGADAMKAALCARPAAVAEAGPQSRDHIPTLPPDDAPTLGTRTKPERAPRRLAIPAWVYGMIGVVALASFTAFIAVNRGATPATNTPDATATERVATATVRATNTVAPSKTPAPPTATRTQTQAPPTNTATSTVTSTNTVAPPTNTRVATKTRLPTETLTQQASPTASVASATTAIPEAGTVSNFQVVGYGSTWVRIRYDYEFFEENQESYRFRIQVMVMAISQAETPTWQGEIAGGYVTAKQRDTIEITYPLYWSACHNVRRQFSTQAIQIRLTVSTGSWQTVRETLATFPFNVSMACS